MTEKLMYLSVLLLDMLLAWQAVSHITGGTLRFSEDLSSWILSAPLYFSSATASYG
jgi:hypothetical protein